MPEEQKTTVLYDISQALKELFKLDKKVKESGTKTKSSFDKAGEGVKKFGGEASSLSPKLGGLISKLGGLATSGGLIAGGFAIAGAAILATVANVFNLAEALADIDAGLKTINSTAERSQGFEELSSTIADELEIAAIRADRTLIVTQKAANARRQNEATLGKDLAAQSLAIEKGRLAAFNALGKKAASDRLSAEKRLQAKLRELSVGQIGGQFSNQTKGGQVISLAAKAQQEAQKGNVSLAEELISKAKELSSELGNHSFFTNKIGSAQNAIVQALKDDVTIAKTKESGLEGEGAQLQTNVDLAKEQLDVFSGQLKTILRLNLELSAQAILIRDSKRLTVESETAEAGGRTVATGIEQLTKSSESIANQSLLGQIRDRIIDVAQAVRNPSTIRSIPEARANVNQIGRAIAEAVKQSGVGAEGGITPTGAIGLADSVARISDALGILERARDEGVQSKAVNRDINRLRNTLQGLTNILKGTAEAAKGGVGAEEQIAPRILSLRARRQDIVAERREQQNISIEIKAQLVDDTTIEKILQQVEQKLRLGTAKE